MIPNPQKHNPGKKKSDGSLQLALQANCAAAMSSSRSSSDSPEMQSEKHPSHLRDLQEQSMFLDHGQWYHQTLIFRK